MEPNLSATEINRQVSLVELLSRLGYQPRSKSGKEFFYLSMIRDSDTKPSFCVNSEYSVWFDHGLGRGGNVVEFAKLYWKNLEFKEVLEEIGRVMNLSPVPTQVRKESREEKRRRFQKVPHYKVDETKPLGNHPSITAYLKSRGVWDVAGERLKEVYYHVLDDNNQRKNFYAAGWKNDLGGWEVRNKYFKGCLGKKALSFIPGDKNKLLVFEGFLDYLSWLFEHRKSQESVIVLNSLVLLPQAIARASHFAEVSIFFDFDRKGREATKSFVEQVPGSSDLSGHYQGHNDYNEKLMSELNNLVKEPFSEYMAKLKVGFSR
ncbi:toprim domain-containing protein [Desertivirga brevis]|uniref:toprim domain-containing protein n=1 Tax=Desertivirga brevis TaxID=2810310 RepID=UPI001A95674C|nr:toprim domain-containing protein [Pedobacter sp. SYSU D00873]